MSRKRNKVNAKKDGNKRNHLSEIFKNGNVLKLIRNISWLLRIKKLGMLVVLFFSAFLCSYTFLLGKKTTSKDIQQSVPMRIPLPEAGGMRPGGDDVRVPPLFWGCCPQSQDFCISGGYEQTGGHSFWFSSACLRFSAYCPLTEGISQSFAWFWYFGVQHTVGTAWVHTLELPRTSCAVFSKEERRGGRCSRRSLVEEGAFILPLSVESAPVFWSLPFLQVLLLDGSPVCLLSHQNYAAPPEPGSGHPAW